MEKNKFEEGLIKQVSSLANAGDGNDGQKKVLVNQAIQIKTQDAKSLKDLQANLKKSQSVISKSINLVTDRDTRNAMQKTVANLNNTLKQKSDKVGADIDAIKSEAKEALAVLDAQKTTDQEDNQTSTIGSFKNTMSFMEESEALLAGNNLQKIEDFLKSSPYLMLQILSTAIMNKPGFPTWSLADIESNPSILRSPEMKVKMQKVANSNFPAFFNSTFKKVFPAAGNNPSAWAKQFSNDTADLNNPRVVELLQRVTNVN